MCSISHTVISLKWNENGCSSFIPLRCVTVTQAPNDKNTIYNFTVNSSKWLEENQDIYFHHHCQGHCIHLFKMTLLTHVIQIRIQVRPEYFINWFWPTWPGQTWPRWLSWSGWPHLVSTLVCIIAYDLAMYYSHAVPTNTPIQLHIHS